MDIRDTLTTPIRTQADLEETWRALMGPLGFSEHLLWLMLLTSDDLPVGTMIQVEIPEEAPPAEEAAEVARFLGHLVDEQGGSRWAVLRSRPGRGGPDPEDLA